MPGSANKVPKPALTGDRIWSAAEPRRETALQVDGNRASDLVMFELELGAPSFDSFSGFSFQSYCSYINTKYYGKITYD
jgi:hypothetical protein